MTTPRARMAFLLAAGLAAGPVLAQSTFAPEAPAEGGAQATVVRPGDGESWGTTTDTLVTLFGHDFQLFQGTEGAINMTTAGRNCAAASCAYFAGLQVPNGATLRQVDLSFCDGDNLGEVRIALFSQSRFPGPATAIVPFSGTGTTATPGCAVLLVPIASPPTVDNQANVYFLDVLAPPGTNLNWNQVRVRYRLQVSPAPATATFPLDVPITHPFFRFVEALAASGLTGGCAPNSFCPDQPVTRGQLSVFLASALGLHFPN